MTKSDKKYADPTDVLKALVDEYGKPVQIGEEKDIGEFNNTFLARISEGLNAHRDSEFEKSVKKANAVE